MTSISPKSSILPNFPQTSQSEQIQCWYDFNNSGQTQSFSPTTQICSCCSRCNTLQNFGLHSISKPSLSFSLMFERTLDLPVSPCWVFPPSLLDRSSNIFFHVGHNVMIAVMFWPCKRYAFVCISCVHYVNIYRTHARSYMNYRASIIAVVQRIITSVTLVSHIVSQSHWVYVTLMIQGVLLSSHLECVFVKSCMYEVTHSHTW